MKCYICGSKNLVVRKTVMSDFLYAKITGGGVSKRRGSQGKSPSVPLQGLHVFFL